MRGGGNDPNPVINVFSSARAFAFVQPGEGYSGIITYGDPAAGGGKFTGVQGALKGLYSTLTAFSAVSASGSFTNWGDTNAGGDASGVSVLLTNVLSIVSSDSAFAALKSNNTVVAWGNTYFLDTNGNGYLPGYPTNLLIGVSSVVATPTAFAALRTNGALVVWGDFTLADSYLPVTLSGIRQVTPSFGAFAALGVNGSVITWGDDGRGGPGRGFIATNVSSGVQQVFANDSAFAALRSNGSVVTWGNTDSGGDSTAVSNALSSNVVILASPFLKIKGAVQVISPDWTTNPILAGLVYSTNANFTLTNLVSLPCAVTNTPSPVQLTASGYAAIRTNGLGSFTINLTGAGTVTLTAMQPGDANFRAAIPVSTSFVVDQGRQSVVFAGISNNLLVYSTNTAANPIKLTLPTSSTAGINLNWSINGNNARLTNVSSLQMLHAGSFTLTATNSGNANYYPIITNYPFTIAKGSQSITMPYLPASITYTADTNAALLTPVLPTNSSIGGLPLSISLSGPGLLTNNRILVTGAGTITLISSNSGSNAAIADYNPIAVTNKISVLPATQTITFLAPAAITYTNGGTTNLTALSSASLPVTLSTTNTNMVAIGTNPVVRIMTTQGSFDMELLVTNAPATAANFLRYLNSGLYLNTFIHRAVPGFIVQGGGFRADTSLTKITTFSAVTNEFGLSNLRGTVAMAKLGGDPNSATSQWFVNLADNSTNLDHQNGGFTVFAKIIGNGTTNVDKIANLPIRSLGSNTPFTDLPLQSLTNGQTSLLLKNLVTITNAYAYYPVSIIGAGTATIVASQGGNANWNAATSVTNKLIVNQVPQVVTFTAITGARSYATNGSLLITAAASGAGAVTNFVSSNTNVLALTNVGTNTVTALIKGAGQAAITATIPAGGNYLAATATTNITVAPATQTIPAFAQIVPQPYGSRLSLTNSNSTAGLPVAFTVKSGPATVSGNLVTVTGIGTVTLAANQAGNTNYTAAPTVTTNFTTTKATQTINFTTPAVVGAGIPLTLAATASSGLAVTYSNVTPSLSTLSGTTLTPKTNGVTLTIVAQQAGNANYFPAPSVTNTIIVEKAQTITFNPLATQTYSRGLVVSVSASNNSGRPLVFTSSNTNIAVVTNSTQLQIIGAGTATITASASGNETYAPAALVSQTLVVAQATQTINFAPPATTTYVSNGTIQFQATASSQLAITYTSSKTNILSIAGATGTMHAKGSVSVTATQAGDTNYKPAAPVTKTITLQ
jgi:cyclophilin family peptidyl-prolyl cis-trans isomerase